MTHRAKGWLQTGYGVLGNLDKELQAAKTERPSSEVQTAFAGRIRTEDIPALVRKGVDIVDIGTAISDVCWLVLSYNVLPES